jgi:hypothetical protein
VNAKWIIGVAMLLAPIATFVADAGSIALKTGPDAELTVARCSVCHTTDYIVMNSVFLNKAGWTAEVNKMVKVMGAPISPDEAARIANYLAQYYGVE